jgi:hypothetical protein
MPPPTTTTTNSVDEHGEDLLTRELGQLSFKDRNDYQGKCYDHSNSIRIRFDSIFI